MREVSNSSHNLLVTEKVGQWFEFGTVDGAAIDLPVDQSLLNGECRQTGDIVDSQLLHDTCAVCYNRPESNIEKVCDLLIRVTLCNQLHDHSFPLG